MTDNYKSLRDALDSHFAECGDVWFTEDDVLFEHESTAQDANLVHVPETDIRLIAAANPETIRALLEERDTLREALAEMLEEYGGRHDSEFRVKDHVALEMIARARSALAQRQGEKHGDQ